MSQLRGGSLAPRGVQARTLSRIPSAPSLQSAALLSSTQPGPLSAPQRSLAPLAAVLQQDRPLTGYENGKHTQNGSGPATGRLLDRGTAFEEAHRIRAYECGPDQRTTIFTISNILQEVAGNHGVAIWGRTEAGFATDPIMVEMNLIFVSTRIQVQMDYYPRWGQSISIETWFQAEGRLAACRNWLIRDAGSRQVLGRGTSTWVMLNTKTRKVSKIPAPMREKLSQLAPDPFRDAISPEYARNKIADVALPAEIEGPPQVARRSDMDMNGHINNVTYLGWALETVPEHIANNNSLYQAEIDFKSECLAGDTVESHCSRIAEDTNGTGIIRYTHLVRCCKDGACRELVKARSTWRPVHVSPKDVHH